MNRGTFIAVVGPSGAGKDTLINAALAARPDICRARRVITRPLAPETEDFESVSAEVFDHRVRAGEFLLHWQAHGLRYGIPAAIRQDLACGHHVIANLSRGVVPEARASLAPIRVIEITGSDDALAQRLAARGREDADEIKARIARAGSKVPDGPDVWRVDNSGTRAAGIASFLAALPQPVSG